MISPRAATIQSNIDQVSANSDIAPDEWMDLSNTASEHEEARMAFLELTPSLNVEDIVNATGWDTETTKELREQLRKRKGAVTDIGADGQAHLLRIVERVLSKYELTLNAIKKCPNTEAVTAISSARWEIAGLSLFELSLNKATAKKALKRIGITLTNRDMNDGEALFMDVGGIKVSQARNVANGFDDDGDLQKIMKPWAHRMSGGSPLMQVVEMGGDKRRAA